MTQTNQNKDYSWIRETIRKAKHGENGGIAEDEAVASIIAGIDKHYIGKGEAQFNWICQPKVCGAYNPYDARMCRVCGSQRPRLFTEQEVEQRCNAARIFLCDNILANGFKSVADMRDFIATVRDHNEREFSTNNKDTLERSE